MSHTSRLRSGLFTVIYVILGMLTVFPVLYMILISLKPDDLLLEYPPSFVFAPTFSHYHQLIVEDQYYLFFGNSAVAAFGATLIAVFLGSLAAYGFTRFRFRGKALIFWSVLIARGFPPATVLIPIYLMIRTIGLSDNILALVLVYSAWQVPLAMWVMRAFFADIPKEIQESAMIDGSGLFGVFFRVMLPLAGPGLLSCAILTFTFCWNEFLFALVLTSFDARTAPVAITSYMEVEGLLQWGRVGAAGVLTILPVIAFMMLMNRYLIRGLTLGAVKG